MFSRAIFKQSLKANVRMFMIATIITSLMMVVMVAVFSPSTISGVGDVLGKTGLIQSTSFLGMLGSTFFAIQGILLPIIFIILTANNLIASQVDKGSMAYLLSTPTKRATVVRTQALFLIASLIIMVGIITGVGVFSIHTFQSDVDVNMTDFYKMMLGLFLLMFSTSSISFFFSSVFNLSKNSLLFGGGIPVAFFLLHLMSSFSPDLEKLKYLSLNTLFDTSAIAKGDNILPNFIILLIIGCSFYIASLIVFDKKDLPL